MTTFTEDDVLAEAATRATAPHLLAAAGVERRVLEAALGGDPTAMTAEEFSRVGRLLGLGERVVDTQGALQEPPDRRVVQAARRIVAAADRARVHVHEPDDLWVAQARRAGVDVEAAWGIDPEAA